MSKIDISAKRVDFAYRIPMVLGDTDIVIKLDTGAKNTVISAKTLNSELDEGALTCMMILSLLTLMRMLMEK